MQYFISYRLLTHPPPHSASIENGELLDWLQSHPHALLLVGLLLLYGLLYILQEGWGGNSKLASGHFAGGREREHARKRSVEQMLGRRHNAVGLYINTPRNRSDSRSLYFPDAQRSTLVIGGPGSGTTFSCIDPMLRSALEQGLPTLLYDFKYPSQAQIAAYATSLGYQVHVFAPGFSESGVINPLEFLKSSTDTESARQLISVMNKNFRISTNSTDNRFFDTGGDQIGEGVLALAKGTDYPDLLMAQTILALPQLPERLATAEHINPWILKSFAQLISVKGAGETVSGLLASASEVFSRFMKPNILSAFCGTSTIPINLDDKQLLIFGMDRQRRSVVGPVVAAIIQMVITHNLTKKRDLPLCVFLDELPTVVLPALAQMVNENRSDGLCCVAGIQSFPQLQKTYGRELAQVILAGFGHKIVFNPQDTESARAFSDYLGNKEIRYQQRSRSRSHKGGTSRSISQQRQTKPLISASELLKLRTGECVVISPGLANRKEAYIPLKTRITIPKADLQKVATSERLWPKVREQLTAHNHQHPPTEEDVLARKQAAEALLPLPEEPEQQIRNFLN